MDSGYVTFGGFTYGYSHRPVCNPCLLGFCSLYSDGVIILYPLILNLWKCGMCVSCIDAIWISLRCSCAVRDGRVSWRIKLSGLMDSMRSVRFPGCMLIASCLGPVLLCVRRSL